MFNKSNSYTGASSSAFGQISKSTVPKQFFKANLKPSLPIMTRSTTPVKTRATTSTTSAVIGPRLASSQKIFNTLDKSRHSLTDHDTFRQRMEIKKMAVARASGVYDQNELLKDRLERKMARESGQAYNTDAKKIEESLRRQDELAADPLLRKVNQPLATEGRSRSEIYNAQIRPQIKN